MEWLGSINVAAPLSRWVLVLFAAGLACAVLGLLVFGHYTRRAHVHGQLVPSTGLLQVNAKLSGSIRRVFVHEGERVRRGQVLLEISGDTDSTAMGDVHATISQRLRAQRAQLETDLSTHRQASLKRSRELKHKLFLLHAQLRQVGIQRNLQSQRVSSDRNLLQRILPLGAKGYISAFQLQQQKTRLLQDQTQARALARQQLDVEQKISNAQQQLAQVPLDLAVQDSAVQRQLNDIAQRLAQNEAVRDVVLRASNDGVISTMLARPGQAVSPGATLLSILPRGATLQARLLVPSRAVGFIGSGSRVVLRYQAYPYQKFGQQYGRIRVISRSALSPTEMFALTGRHFDQPLYRVKVHLDSQHILAYGKTQALKPGMALDADILMDRRTLLEWVFEPLYGMKSSGFESGVPHA